MCVYAEFHIARIIILCITSHFAAQAAGSLQFCTRAWAQAHPGVRVLQNE